MNYVRADKIGGGGGGGVQPPGYVMLEKKLFWSQNLHS